MSRIIAFSGRAALALATLVVASSLPAQSLTIPAQPPTVTTTSMTNSATTSPTEVAPLSSLTGPRITSVGIARSAATAPGANAIQDTPSRRDVAWMVLGGATLIVGSIVGGDGGTILMVTGGVIGLVGLWRYLQYS